MHPAPEPPFADLVYSLALGGAMGAVTAAWALWALARARRRPRRWARRTAALATALALLSLAVHLAFGHPPGSERALGVRGFASEHPALLVVGALGLAALWATRGGAARAGAAAEG